MSNCRSCGRPRREPELEYLYGLERRPWDDHDASAARVFLDAVKRFLSDYDQWTHHAQGLVSRYEATLNKPTATWDDIHVVHLMNLRGQTDLSVWLMQIIDWALAGYGRKLAEALRDQ